MTNGEQARAMVCQMWPHIAKRDVDPADEDGVWSRGLDDLTEAQMERGLTWLAQRTNPCTVPGPIREAALAEPQRVTTYRPPRRPERTEEGDRIAAESIAEVRRMLGQREPPPAPEAPIDPFNEAEWHDFQERERERERELAERFDRQETDE